MKGLRLGLSLVGVRKPNLVTNGTFDTNTTGWTAGNNAALSVVSGRLRVTNPDPGQTGYAHQSMATTVGHRYRVTAVLTNGTLNANLRVGTSPAGSQYFAATSGPVDQEFTATGTTVVVSAINSGSVALGYSEFDNITLRRA